MGDAAPRSDASRLQRWWSRRVVGSIDRASVIAKVDAEAGWSGRYAFMILLSAGIAILGLLQSSPAVIIGAMLISPLMGPIIGLGFALAVFDASEVRRSVGALCLGSLLAIGCAVLIVTLSPLQSVTPVILARARPNLLDLLIAIFSALAGSYATIRGRGATIVGVAIATALMPPLATVGFGLATGRPAIAGGALALFLTNLVAIALCATATARVYGFGRDLSPRQSRLQLFGIIAVLIVMAIPLGLALRQIAWESIATRQVRTIIADSFSDRSRIGEFDLDLTASPIAANVVVLTDRYQPDAQPKIAAALQDGIKRPVTLRLQQVVVNRDDARLDSARSAADAIRDATREAASVADALAALAGVAPTAVVVDADGRRATALAASPANPARLQAGEAALIARHPGWAITVQPPVDGEIAIRFAAGSSDFDADAKAAIATAAWALRRWGVHSVLVTGHAAASHDGNNTLALARASTVATALVARGFEVDTGVAPAGPEQLALERERGAAVFRRADIRPAIRLAPSPAGPAS